MLVIVILYIIFNSHLSIKSTKPSFYKNNKTEVSPILKDGTKVELTRTIMR